MAYATRSRGSDLSSSSRTTMTPNRLSSVQNVSTHATQLPSPLVSAPAVLPAPTDSMENVTWTASSMTDQVQPSKDDRYYQMISQNALKNHHVRFKDSGNDTSQPHDDFDKTSNARDNLDIDLNLSHMNHQMQSNCDRKRGGRREIEGEDTIRLRDRLGLSSQLPQEPPRMAMKSSLSTNIPDESSLPRHVRFEMDSPLNLSVGQHLRYEERDGAGMDVDAAEGSGTKLTTEHEGGTEMDMEIESLSSRSGNDVESEGSGLIARAGRAFSSILFSKPEENGLSLNSDMEEDGEPKQYQCQHEYQCQHQQQHDNNIHNNQ
ncbi:hypothetical protein BGZ98_008104 [Dissophora globulifera]|nr:hypothetical protein BGZ98_008104 [Dissophora globulifera]